MPQQIEGDVLLSAKGGGGAISEDQQADMPLGFRVVDESSANWLVRKLLEARSYACRVEAWAAAEIQRAQNDERRLMARFGLQLEEWAARQLQESNCRCKSIRLPAGTVGFRRQPCRIATLDESALLEWCRHNLPQGVKVVVEACGTGGAQLATWVKRHCPDGRVSEHVLTSVIHTHYSTTGECPEGAQPIGGNDRFFVR
jgi:hypothetical protein